MSVQCTYIEESVLESHGRVSRHVMSCGSRDKRQRSVCDTGICTYMEELLPVLLHGLVEPGEVVEC